MSLVKVFCFCKCNYFYVIINKNIKEKKNFKCQKEGCNKEHNTLLHPPASEPDGGGTSQSQLNREGLRLNTIDV